MPRVIEKMAATTGIKLMLERIDGDKVVVTSNISPGKITVLKGKVLEVRVVEGRLRIARKDRTHDQGDPPVEPYDPYGPGIAKEEPVIDHSADVGTDASTDAGTDAEPVTRHAAPVSDHSRVDAVDGGAE